MGNYHVRFLGEGAAEMPLPYPTEGGTSSCRPISGRKSGEPNPAPHVCYAAFLALLSIFGAGWGAFSADLRYPS
jgi:hypothetical protein